jgi:carboxylesterase
MRPISFTKILIIFGSLLALLSSFSILFIGLDLSVIDSLKNEEQEIRLPLIQERLKERTYSGNPPALLLIHGFGGSPIDLQPLEERLKKENIAFYSLLLKGHGTSVLDLSKTQALDWILQVHGAFDRLISEYGTVSVVGFSMGGALALELASQYSVEKVVLINPFFRATRKWFYFGSPDSWARLLAPFVPFIRKPKIGQINSQKGLKQYFAYRYFSIRAVRQLQEIAQRGAISAINVKAPVLFLISPKDNVADSTVTKEIFDSISAPKRIVFYPNSNHILLYEEDDKRAIQEILLFLKGDPHENTTSPIRQ